jgi:hypothetical protein
MKKLIILSNLIFFSMALKAQSQSDLLLSSYKDCKDRANSILDSIGNLNQNYEIDRDQFAAGLFCSDCGRSKRLIEQQEHVSFEVHIQQGAADGRHVVGASKSQLDALRKNYLSSWSSYNDQYNSTLKDCMNIRDDYNTTKDAGVNQKNEENLKANQKRQEDERNKRSAAINEIENKYELKQKEIYQHFKSFQDNLSNLQIQPSNIKSETATEIEGQAEKYKIEFGNNNYNLPSNNSSINVNSVITNSDNLSFDNVEIISQNNNLDDLSSISVSQDQISDFLKPYLNADGRLLGENYETLKDVSGIINDVNNGNISNDIGNKFLDNPSSINPIISKMQKTAFGYDIKSRDATIGILNQTEISINNLIGISNSNSAQTIDAEFSNYIFQSNPNNFADHPQDINNWVDMKKKAAGTILAGSFLLIAGAPALPVIGIAALYNLW